MFEAPRQTSPIKNYLNDQNPQENGIKGIECLICNQNISQEEMKSICKCGHIFCQECLNYFIVYKIKNEFSLVQCPREGCSEFMDTSSEMFKSLSLQLRQRYMKIQENINILRGKVQKLCPDCSIELTGIKGKQQLFCQKCLTKYCPKCMGKAHPRLFNCERYIINFLKKNYQFKRCSRCLFIIERKEGCSHMTCICKYQFCYSCGGDWDRGNHICPPKPKYVKPLVYRVVQKERPVRETLKPNVLNLMFLDNNSNIQSKGKRPIQYHKFKKNNNKSIIYSQQDTKKNSENYQNQSTFRESHIKPNMK